MVNRAVFFVSMAFSLFSFTNAQSDKLIYNQLIKSKDTVYYHVPIGLCEDYPEETTTLEIIRKDMELLKRSGINLLRISFGWDGIETQKDNYTWGFWDDYVRIAVDEYGITLIPYICYTPAWNSTGDTTNFWNHTPKDYEEFGEFVFDLVTRFKDRIKSWELWNEADIKAYWSGDAEDYARLTKIGSQAVRRADPNAIVVLAGLAGHTEFIRTLFRDFDLSPYVDVVNLHSYCETWEEKPLESLVGYVNTVADIIKTYGNNQSIWMAEVGYSTYRKPDGYVSDQYWCTYEYEHTLNYQPVVLIRTLTLALSTNKLAAITWYEIKDLPPEEIVIGDVNNRHLGVAFVNHAPKPAEKALLFFNKLFAQRYRCIDDHVVVQRIIGSGSEVHCFEMESGDMIVVAWLQTYIPGRIGNEPIGNLKDTRRETITLTLPKKLTGKAVMYDELGNEKVFKNLEARGNTTTIKGLPLVGGTVAIINISK